MPFPEGALTSAGLRGRFATTEWSLVSAAGEGNSVAAAHALERLCGLYWYPIFAFVRRKGHAAEDAQDLTQGFFARLIEKGDLADADRNRGRFRSFLLSACQHYLLNQRDRSLAQKRGGDRETVPIDIATAEGHYERALSHSETPERLYERQWCLTLLTGVLDDLREDYAASGRERVFDRLKVFLTADDGAGTHEDAARDLDMSTVAVRVAVHRLRLRYRETLQRRVADTVLRPQDVEEEIRYLLKTLGNAQEDL